MAHLCSGDIAAADFLWLIEKHPWPADALFIAFTPSDSRFEKFVINRDFLSKTEQGKIFSGTGELSWRFMDPLYRLVYLGQAPVPEGLADHSHELAGLTPSSENYLLWGERTENQNEWLEQQVPQRFSYPIDSAVHRRGRVALKVELWSDNAGLPVFGRYQGIEEINSGE